MPCHDTRNEPSYVAEEVRRDCRHNSDVAELLCSTMRSMTTRELALVTSQVKGLGQWWDEHLERDRKKAKDARKGNKKR